MRREQDMPARGGTYILLAELAEDTRIQVGKLGEIAFRRGYYAYVGSALRGLDARVARHRRRDKKLHWHIDYLLQHAHVLDIITIESTERLECPVASSLADRFTTIPRFGSSDCRCASHLFWSEELPLALPGGQQR